MGAFVLSRLLSKGPPKPGAGAAGAGDGPRDGQGSRKWFPEHQRSQWFREHHDEAAGRVVDFFETVFVDLGGKTVADVGCGDGIIDLGIAHKARPARLVGFDTRPTDRDLLARLDREEGGGGGLPESLEFVTCERNHLPADDASFDHVYSWSAFEHIQDPLAVIREIRRILRPGGLLMIQVWPFYHSEHGSHLWEWFPRGFAQFLHEPEELEATVRANPGPDPEWAEAVLWAYRHLNQITLDDLQRSLQLGGFRTVRVHPMTGALQPPVEVAKLPLSLITIAGVELLATPY